MQWELIYLKKPTIIEFEKKNTTKQLTSNMDISFRQFANEFYQKVNK